MNDTGNGIARERVSDLELIDPAIIAENAFDRGRLAALEGQDATANRYVGAILRDIWWRGYSAGLQEKQEDTEANG